VGASAARSGVRMVWLGLSGAVSGLGARGRSASGAGALGLVAGVAGVARGSKRTAIVCYIRSMRTLIKRTRRTLAFGVVLGALITCGGLDTFDVEQSATTTIPGGSPIPFLDTLFDFAGFNEFDISQSSEFENQGVSKDDIDSVTMTSLRLRVISPDGADLSFLDSIEFFVDAEGLSKKRIAKGSSFPAGAREVELDVEDVDLKPYAVKDAMQITAKASGENPPQDIEVAADVVLSVDVNVSGVLCGR
jgi:hypothetical protein